MHEAVQRTSVISVGVRHLVTGNSQGTHGGNKQRFKEMYGTLRANNN
jgi:hypothetical protein